MTIAEVTADTPATAVWVIWSVLSWSQLVAWSMALSIWSLCSSSGGPATQSWIFSTPSVPLSTSSPAWSATLGAIAAMMPAKTPKKTSSEVRTASALGKCHFLSCRESGHSTVQTMIERMIGRMPAHSFAEPIHRM